MNIILSSDIFIYFLNTLILAKACRDEDLMTHNVFLKKSNVLSVSNKTIEETEVVAKKIGHIDYFQAFIKDAFDNNRLSSYHANNEVEGILNHYSNIMDELKFIFTESNLELNKHVSKVCVLNKVSKPNKDWILLNVMANKTVTLRYNDFANQKEIERMFEDFFSLSDAEKDVFMIDSYCNVFNHTLFEAIMSKGYKVRIYTSSFKKADNEKLVIRANLKEYFGKKKTEVKFSSDKKILHERSIVIACFTLEANHDFAEIKRTNSNWKIDITACHDLKNENLQKCGNYA